MGWATRVGIALALLAAGTLWQGAHALAAVGYYLVVEDAPSRADAIVVLSGDGGARVRQGVDLFKASYAPLLILVGGGAQGNPPAAEGMRHQAVSLGIPDSAILLVKQSTSTWEDAKYTRQLMDQRGLRSAILVTSPYHERRASMTFTRAFEGSGVSLASYPVQDDQWQPDSWWKSRRTIILTLTELAKLAYYKLNGYI